MRHDGTLNVCAIDIRERGGLLIANGKKTQICGYKGKSK